MLISNFNLCKSEWLELVFAKRNKEYGAYYIRQHHSETVLKSFVIGVFSVAVLVGVIGIIIKPKPITNPMRMVNTELQVYKIPPAPKVQPPKPKVEAPKPAAAASIPINTTRFVPMVVTPDPIAVEPPKIEDLKGSVGQADIKTGVAGISTGDGSNKSGIGTGAGDSESTTNEPFTAVEVMPQPVGGDAAWARFLQSNIHYPDKAMENEVSGKVFVTFIIEKDGHISNVKVERGPGFGTEEEAVRVLKLAKPWKPGMQNGRAVRVQLTLPVVFTLSN
ncbi:TonB family protein [Mucilaginibacter panaciglaebae]|uniref:Energy transducer TonB n=1 Tax=Mucilaginibacter panaciglaebae TaxID=502331 RepID=A0ABP7X2J8_9SPHI